ncbi:hypothetical protein [Pasteuria penetrans]|uniref:hypothetical protein n=1 Tax=Pasteuria penetrans TaxID=86005 RepID=UPI000F9912EC|nr:hypothetical protein [Pasteuria penetrans]
MRTLWRGLFFFLRIISGLFGIIVCSFFFFVLTSDWEDSEYEDTFLMQRQSPSAQALRLSIYADSSFRRYYPKWKQKIERWVHRAGVRLFKKTQIQLKIICYHPWETRSILDGGSSLYLDHLNWFSQKIHRSPAPVHFVVGFTVRDDFLNLRTPSHSKQGGSMNGTLGVSGMRWRMDRVTKEKRPDTSDPVYSVVYTGRRQTGDEGIVLTLQHELSHLLGILSHDDRSPNLMNSVLHQHTSYISRWLPEHIPIIRSWALAYLRDTRRNPRRCPISS